MINLRTCKLVQIFERRFPQVMSTDDKRKTNGRPKAGELTHQEKLFIEAYVVDFDPRNAIKKAGYITDNPGQKAGALLRKEKIKKEIEKRLEKKRDSFFIQEHDVMTALWKEANREGKGSSHSARINALVWLGKHLGMFQEKREEEKGDGKIVFQVLNYHAPEEPSEPKTVQGEVIEAEAPSEQLLQQPSGPRSPDAEGVSPNKVHEELVKEATDERNKNGVKIQSYVNPELKKHPKVVDDED